MSRFIYHREDELPKDGERFVFGSNLAGRHLTETQVIARTKFYAAKYIGRGPTGYAYALPIEDANVFRLSLNKIKENIREFQAYGQRNLRLKFFVTRIGCESAGYSDADIAPLFPCQRIVTTNFRCSFPIEWKPYLE